MKTYTLSLHPAYVSHWGLWEAIREILQNAYDQRDAGEALVEFEKFGDVVIISTSTGKLARSSLLLGGGDKRSDPNLRGQFGEGYKLALLVLCGLKKSVTIYNGSEIWTPRIDRDDDFGCDVLKVDVEEDAVAPAGVDFIIRGISPEEWAEIGRNVCSICGIDWILHEPSEVGRIYVGGLYVATVKNYRAGYHFSPGTVKLDRDRGMIDGFDLSYATSRLWARQSDEDVYPLMKAEAPDVAYCEHHVPEQDEAPLVRGVYRSYRHEFGDAVPVATQAEVERAQRAGIKWALVPRTIYAILSKIVSVFIPSKESPAERIRDFIKRHKWDLQSAMIQELEDIAEAIEPKTAEAATA